MLCVHTLQTISILFSHPFRLAESARKSSTQNKHKRRIEYYLTSFIFTFMCSQNNILLLFIYILFCHIV